jgi:hypothetical protein
MSSLVFLPPRYQYQVTLLKKVTQMQSNMETQKFRSDAGIAIGPILFIIAILAILAAAIAAGSGSFTSGTTTESNRTKSSALVQIGENLKIGMDRITMEGGLTPSSVVINTLNTSQSNALFSPTGGGIAAPTVSMANNTVTDQWYYVTGPINGLGTGAGNVFAVLRVAPGVCSEINNRTTGTSQTPTGADLGNFASQATVTAGTVTNWPSSLVGLSTGCVNNTNAGSTGTYFYQVMAIQ